MKYATDQAIAEYCAAILHFMQPADMALQQSADDLFTRSSKVAAIFGGKPMGDVFIEGSILPSAIAPVITRKISKKRP